jgi:hypothetical protein
MVFLQYTILIGRISLIVTHAQHANKRRQIPPILIPVITHIKIGFVATIAKVKKFWQWFSNGDVILFPKPGERKTKTGIDKGQKPAKLFEQ